jgi:hypothetical protein
LGLDVPARPWQVEEELGDLTQQVEGFLSVGTDQLVPWSLKDEQLGETGPTALQDPQDLPGVGQPTPKVIGSGQRSRGRVRLSKWSGGRAQPQRLDLLQSLGLEGEGVAVVAADHHKAVVGVDRKDLTGDAVGDVAPFGPAVEVGRMKRTRSLAWTCSQRPVTRSVTTLAFLPLRFLLNRQ